MSSDFLPKPEDLPPVQETLRRHARSETLRQVADAAVWFFLALAAVAAFVGYLLAPDFAQHSAIGQSTASAGLWAALLALSGVVILAGLLRCKPDIEGAGLVFFAGLLLVDWIAVLLVRPASVATLLLPALALGGLVRVWSMHKRAQILKEGE